MPSQYPSLPQVMAPASAHCMSGSIPAGTLVHVPPLPGSAHDLQVPAQVVAQQTPVAQMLELHSASAPQVAPSGFLPQLPLTQVAGGTQSVSFMHVVAHWPFVPHMNGAQDCDPAVGQAPPWPSQRPADVSVEPLQPAVWHIVPAE
jgi:hypothetical protein